MDVWQSFLSTHLAGLDERWIFVIGTWLVHMITFWGLNGILFIFYRYNLFPDKRINHGQMPPQSLINECLFNLAVSNFIVQPAGLYFGYDLFKYFGMDVFGPIPGPMIWARDFLVAVALNDTLFYWCHRLLHHPSIYQYVHKKHHRFNWSIGIAAEFANPIEEVFSNLIPTLAANIFLGSHIVVFWAWLAMRLWETIDVHSGYSFSFSPFSLLPFQGGAARHDFHHAKNVGCYGSFTIFWDSVMGTDKAFLEFQEKEKQRLKEKSK